MPGQMSLPWTAYCISFTDIEHVNRKPVWIVHCQLDDAIPFWKYAVYFCLSRHPCDSFLPAGYGGKREQAWQEALLNISETGSADPVSF